MRNTITKFGVSLYGLRFQSELARDLGVNDRTMRRWLANDTEPPPGVIDDLKSLVRQRIELLRTLL